ncbi:MAG: extracellular solute-binding protein [Melioribacteraceae bacterium]|nr:extracellular solute-binding protein [Melioribacteraceae bacterium]
MTIKIKQKWGLAFLVLVTFIYVIINVLDFYSIGVDVKEIYFADRITAAHEIIIEKYNRLNKGRVRVIPIDFPNYDFSTNERKELLARSLRGRGDGIDLFAVDVVWVQRFAKWSEPLDKYFSRDERARLLKSAMESCYNDSVLVAVPLDAVQTVMYYREDLLLQLEQGREIISKVKNQITWEEFIKLKKYTDNNSPLYIFPAADYEGLICSFTELLLSIKPDYFEVEGFNLMTQEAKKALTLLVDLVHKYKVTPQIVTEFTEVPSYEYFIKNDGYFIWGWPSYDKDFIQSPFDPDKEKHLRKAPLPHFKEGKPTSVIGGWNLMISKFSDKKEEVVEFVKYLLSDESQEIFYTEAGYYPVIEKFYTSEEYILKYPEAHEVKDHLKTGVHRPAHVEYTRYSEILSHFFEMAIRNEISVDGALIESTNAIEEDKVITKQF